LPYGAKFEEALVHAARLHREGVRKGTAIPYVTHLLAVAAIVGENGGTEDEVVAALLHDAIEDTPETEASLAARFGPAVAEIVAACSDTDVTPKPPWKERKEAYVARAAGLPNSARLVSSADKLHNARSILADLRMEGDALWGRFTGGKEGTLWYYRALVEAYGASGATPVVEELDRVVSEIEDLARRGPA
jgi:(p)ppGpp synthase/HD superfamily hydrolase